MKKLREGKTREDFDHNYELYLTEGYSIVEAKLLAYKHIRGKLPANKLAQIKDRGNLSEDVKSILDIDNNKGE